MFALAPVEPAPGRADAKQERTWGPVGSPLQPRRKTSERSVALLDAFALLLAAVIIALFQRFRA